MEVASTMKNRILFVSSYNSLTLAARKISEEMGLDLHIYQGGIMENGHLYAKKHQDLYDVIISLGATAEAIKNLVSVPVVVIELQTVDMLNTLYEASSYGEKIALVVFKSENSTNIENLKYMLNIDFNVFSYTTKEELEKQLNVAINLGISTLVGIGDCILEIGKEHNLNSIAIYVREKQLREALITAKNICDLSKRNQERTKRFKMIIDYSGYGIIALDDKDRIVTFNPIAEKIFNLQSSQVLERSIHQNISKPLITDIYGNKEKLLNKLVKINNKQFIMNRLPIIIGQEMFSVVITFQEITKLQELEKKVRIQLYKNGLIAKYTFGDIIGESKAIKNTIEEAKMIGKTDTTVLINGETGSGKELFAQSIHNISSRNKGPFVAVNCAAMPESLFESALFGYEEGAFTGAKKGGKLGLFEIAHGGTIFLDEVSEIPMILQGRLLRVLQEREVLRIGADYIVNVDIRVIAATNTNLIELIKKGKFRQDLYYRLNILDLRIPPLRERKEDIPILVKYLIKKINIKHGTNICNVLDGAIKPLEGYNWSGNIRQLENFTEKMCILSNSTTIDEVLVNQLFYNNSEYNAVAATSTEIKNGSECPSITVNLGNLKYIEQQIIVQASKIFKDDKTILAEKLGISRTTLWKKLKEISTPKK